MFVFIGIIACLIGFLMIFDVWRFKGVADIGVVVFLIGIISIFICLMGVPVNAANGYPTAGISEVMINATVEPLTVKESPVVEVA